MANPAISKLKVAGVKVYLRWNHNSRAHAVTAGIDLWRHGRCDIMGWSHALTAWDLKFQVCLGYTFTSSYFAFAFPYLGFTIKVYLHWQCFYGDIASNSDMWQSLLTCLGHHGQCNKDRIISIYVIPPKVAKASEYDCLCCRCYHITFANVNTA